MSSIFCNLLGYVYFDQSSKSIYHQSSANSKNCQSIQKSKQKFIILITYNCQWKSELQKANCIIHKFLSEIFH